MKNQFKILVVDDEQGWRDLLSFELRNEGHEVSIASGPEEAQNYLSQSNFDFVITDIRMPGGVDGIDFVQNCWQKDKAQKVIFMTGYALEEKIQDALKESHRALCLRKPFEHHELQKAMQALSH